VEVQGLESASEAVGTVSKTDDLMASRKPKEGKAP
jgi:hypothetical protein